MSTAHGLSQNACRIRQPRKERAPDSFTDIRGLRSVSRRRETSSHVLDHHFPIDWRASNRASSLKPEQRRGPTHGPVSLDAPDPWPPSSRRWRPYRRTKARSWYASTQSTPQRAALASNRFHCASTTRAMRLMSKVPSASDAQLRARAFQGRLAKHHHRCSRRRPFDTPSLGSLAVACPTSAAMPGGRCRRSQ